MIVAYITDLFFQAKVEETARLLAAGLKIVSSASDLSRALEQDSSLLLVDLNASGDPAGLIAQAKRKNPRLPVIAYFSHVQTELEEKALRAGADRVLPRSRFSRELARILRGEDPT